MNRQILDFERGWFLHPEPKDRSITDVLGLQPWSKFAAHGAAKAAQIHDFITAGGSAANR